MEEVLRVLTDSLGTLVKRVSTLEVREQQPVKMQVAPANADLTLTNATQVVPNTFLTLSGGLYIAVGIFEVLTSNDDLDNNQVATGYLSVNGFELTPVVTTTLVRIAGATRLRTTMTGMWDFVVPFQAVQGAHIRAKKSGGTGSSQVLQVNSKLYTIRYATNGL